MVNVVLFHSALGLRPAVRRFADALREDGHTVHTPDLFGGKVFDDLEAGAAERDAIGVPELLRRATEAVDGLPQDLVYAGFSMGTMPAQLFAGTRPGARGALLMQGGAAPEHLGLETWPADVAVQLHVAVNDPWFTGEEAAQIVAAIPDGRLDYHEYASDRHLFADKDWDEYDPDDAAAMLTAVRGWLRSVDT